MPSVCFVQIVGQKNLLRSLSRNPLYTGRVEGLPFLEFLRLAEERLALFQQQESKRDA